MNEIAVQNFNQITKTHRGIIPETIDAVTGQLNGLGGLLNSSDWYRAAVVSAYTEKGSGGPRTAREIVQLSIREFSELGIRGLSTQDAVRHYFKAWESTGRDKPLPGEVVELPDIPFPEWGLTKPHVSQNSGENEWYTPPEIIEAARKTMGSIDLDPASSELANEIVKAAEIFTKENDGLSQTWIGNVWLNPPYAQPLISGFSDKLINELPNITQACVLVNNATETTWLQNMMEKCDAVCFIKGRVRFLDINGKPGAPLQGQVILYFGLDTDLFHVNFKIFGICLMRTKREYREKHR